MSLQTPDLTKFPPRSPRVRLANEELLPFPDEVAHLAGEHAENVDREDPGEDKMRPVTTGVLARDVSEGESSR